MNADSKFTLEEDFFLFKLVRMFTDKNWKIISMYFNKVFPKSTKNSKQCKSRWFNNLEINSKKKGWSLLEDYIFFKSKSKLGNKWAAISKFLPGRTDNNIKNHFYSTIRKNIGRISKGKSFTTCIKDKLKRYYSLVHIRDKYILMKPYFDTKTCKLDIDSVKKSSPEITANFDDDFVSQLLTDTKGSLEEMDKLIQNLCEDIMKSKNDTNKNSMEILIQNLTENNPNIEVNPNLSFKHLEILDLAVKEIINQAALNTSLKYITSSDILKHINSIFRVKKDENLEKFANLKKLNTNPTLLLKHPHKKISDCNLENLIDKFVESYDNKSTYINNKAKNESLEDILNSLFKNDNEKLNIPYFTEKEEDCLPYQEINEPFKFSSNGEMYQQTIEGAIIDTFMGEYNINAQENIFSFQDGFDNSYKYPFNFFEQSENGENREKRDSGESIKLMSGLLNKKRPRRQFTQNN